MRGIYRIALTTLCIIVICFGLYMIPHTVGWSW